MNTCAVAVVCFGSFVPTSIQVVVVVLLSVYLSTQIWDSHLAGVSWIIVAHALIQEDHLKHHGSRELPGYVWSRFGCMSSHIHFFGSCLENWAGIFPGICCSDAVFQELAYGFNRYLVLLSFSFNIIWVCLLLRLCSNHTYYIEFGRLYLFIQESEMLQHANLMQTSSCWCSHSLEFVQLRAHVN